jgi:hypothetical protein
VLCHHGSTSRDNCCLWSCRPANSPGAATGRRSIPVNHQTMAGPQNPRGQTCSGPAAKADRALLLWMPKHRFATTTLHAHNVHRTRCCCCSGWWLALLLLLHGSWTWSRRHDSDAGYNSCPARLPSQRCGGAVKARMHLTIVPCKHRAV